MSLPTWYFCPAHLVFHAIFLFAGSPQPSCGECAVLFFHQAHRATWLQKYDVGAVLSNVSRVFRDVVADTTRLLDEIDEIQPHQAQDLDLSMPPCEVSNDVFNEIPRGDWTYRSLGTRLIPHKRFADTYLLEYRTFQGALAYQPCSRNIRSMGLFDSLQPLEPNGDQVFKEAREWSCVTQSIFALPRELRWVLATIYNFANEVLRLDSDENTAWQMRSWLVHWYTVADELFKFFGILAESPEVDWFSRPCATPETLPQQVHKSPTNRQSNGTDSSSARTIVRHFNSLRNAGNEQQYQVRHSNAALIHGWLSTQTRLPQLHDTALFDPAPGGYASSWANLPPAAARWSRESSMAASSNLNPAAPAFMPVPPPTVCSTFTSREDSHDFDEGYASQSDCGKEILSQPQTLSV
ncbi:hypothetical protein PLICBS_001594 [Purpureocillium lilacinum]|uniref:uncharacterized protein n=1 Tax=Purpureocillium lilacinum TaxID=33203 RepID=UPI0020810A93|nr:hypothetical protein PLICBS_001594 [Purpureocillium lilacinum]